jgi:hypothetical protein
MRVQQPRWSVDSAGWSVDITPECVALSPADIDAALQISCHIKRAGNVTEDEIREFAARDAELCGYEPRPVTAGKFSGLTAEFVEGDIFWRRWWLRCDQVHLYITYNVGAPDSRAHTDVVDWIVSTLRAHDPAM